MWGSVRGFSHAMMVYWRDCILHVSGVCVLPYNTTGVSRVAARQEVWTVQDLPTTTAALHSASVRTSVGPHRSSRRPPATVPSAPVNTVTTPKTMSAVLLSSCSASQPALAPQ